MFVIFLLNNAKVVGESSSKKNLTWISSGEIGRLRFFDDDVTDIVHVCKSHMEISFLIFFYAADDIR